MGRQSHPKVPHAGEEIFFVELVPGAIWGLRRQRCRRGAQREDCYPWAQIDVARGRSEEAKPITEDAKVRASQEAIKGRVPHKIVMPQGTTADMWASVYIKAISDAQSQIDITEWDKQ